ncbi:MAG TPA: inositol monophosphatase [Xanthomonadales bacterium]|nr:inositol monophosphatase [Xanthomonadales bacterium]
MKYREFITDVLQGASKIAIDKFGKVTGTTKKEDNNQVLTEADLAIGKYIVGKLQIHYPDYNVIDEEAGVIDNGSEFTWVVDPIDGSSNFAVGAPTYGIMIGLLNGSESIAGGFLSPSINEIYIAEKGNGAYLNGERIFVTKEQNLANCLVAYGIDGHQEDPEFTRNEIKLLGEIILHIRNLRTSGSEPVDVGWVASGKYGARLVQCQKIWDLVAPQIIIEEAGGIFTDFWGAPIDYSNPLKRTSENFTVCAASPELHKQLQDIIHSKV